MNSSWAAVAAVVVMILAVGGLIWRDGRRDGRLDTIVERLTDIAEDHEDRIRGLEGHPAPGHRRPRFSRGDAGQPQPWRPHGPS